MNILGINISQKNKVEVLETIESNLKNSIQYHITTLNPEIILSAQKDAELFSILNNSQLAIPDGIGLKIAAWLLGKNISRTTGADITKEILEIAENQNKEIGIIIRQDGLSSKTEIEEAIKKHYPRLVFSVSALDLNKIKDQVSHINISVQNKNTRILFCSFGAPYQEKFISNVLKQNNFILLGIGVGGSFDYITNKTQRAPEVIQAVGFEWLWRLYIQPSRYKRIINATIVFPLAFVKWHLLGQGDKK
ncbi:MAG: WecB/TagA/CpsF family glycosyltransferase [Candidatus Falkowbacteria bacterium]|nr:WecB/TagA/CpsF family glycosyltransferase [Candidatus Falkowbacteria bacterium]